MPQMMIRLVPAGSEEEEQQQQVAGEEVVEGGGEAAHLFAVDSRRKRTD